jgi:hypothetical protein
VREANELPKRSDRWLLWLTVCLVGFGTFYSVSSFIHNNLRYTITPTLPPTPPPEVSESDHFVRRYQTNAYSAKFCGKELVRDDNPDGRDTLDAIQRVTILFDWSAVLISLVCGVIAAGAVNIFWRLAVKPRRGDRE